MGMHYLDAYIMVTHCLLRQPDYMHLGVTTAQNFDSMPLSLTDTGPIYRYLICFSYSLKNWTSPAFPQHFMDMST